MAEARPWTQARSQARVTSQITTSGERAKHRREPVSGTGCLAGSSIALTSSQPGLLAGRRMRQRLLYEYDLDQRDAKIRTRIAGPFRQAPKEVGIPESRK